MLIKKFNLINYEASFKYSTFVLLLQLSWAKSYAKKCQLGQTELALGNNKNLSLIKRADYDSTSEIKFDTYCPFYIDSFNIAGHRFSINLIFSTKTKKLARIAFMLKDPKPEKKYDTIPSYFLAKFGTPNYNNITPVSDEMVIIDNAEAAARVGGGSMDEIKWKNQHSTIDLTSYNIYTKRKGDYRSLSILFTDIQFLEELEKEKGAKKVLSPGN